MTSSMWFSCKSSGFWRLARKAIDCSVKDITFEDIQIFNSLFKFLTILVIAIKGNSLAMHFITLAKISVPAVMVTIDNKIKSLLGKENPDVFGITEEEGQAIG